MSVIEEENCFTFTWMLEKASYCLQKKGEGIESPAFVVDEIKKTKWNLWLYPRGAKNGNYIGCFLRRLFPSANQTTCISSRARIRTHGLSSYNLYKEPMIKDDDSVEIKYELAFIGESGLALTTHDLIQRSFRKDEGYGYPKFQKREDVFILKRSTFLPKDTLTVRCKIWKNVGEMEENIRCFARTLIGVEKRSFVWELEDFSTLEPEKEYTYMIKSLETDTELMSLNLCLAGGQNGEEMIHFKIICLDKNVKYCALRLCLVGILQGRFECCEDEFWFDKRGDIQRFTYMLSRQKLMKLKGWYLPGDVLSLQWEWAFSKGIVSERIEQVQFGYIVPKSNQMLENMSNLSISE